MVLLRSLVFVFLAVAALPACYGQNKETILSKKYSPAQLRQDAEVFAEVSLAMHPAIGIYEPRNYYIDLFNRFISGLSDSLTEKQFRLKAKLVADELHCGHTEVIYSKAYYRYMSKQQLSYSPYVFLPVHDKLYVIANLAKKMDSTLSRGTEITKINGVTADSMLRYCRRFISSDGYNQTSKEHYIQLGFNAYYLSLFGRPDTFVVEYRDGKALKELKYKAFKLKDFPIIPFGPKKDSLLHRYKRAGLSYRFLDSTEKTMELKIERFGHNRYRHIYRRVFRKMRKRQAENLVIDLRNNGGGSLSNTYCLLSYLLDSPATQTLRTGIHSYPFRKYTGGNIWFKMTRLAYKIIGKKVTVHDTDNFIYTIKPKRKNHFDKKVIVLINGGSFSASCLVAAYLKYHNRATFIGQETGGAIEGCNAGITPYYRLPNTHIKVRMPAFRIVHDVEPEITGHGILPDYKTDYSLKDILSKRDLEMQKAKELLDIKNNEFNQKHPGSSKDRQSNK